MDLVYLSTLLVVVLASLVWLVYHLKSKQAPETKVYNLPPGPRPLPLIGNLLELSSNPLRRLQALAKQYGPVMTLKMGSYTTVFLNESSVVRNVMAVRGRNFDHRPVLDTWITYAAGKGIAMSSGEYWKKIRNSVHATLFSTKVLEDASRIITSEFEQLAAFWESAVNTERNITPDLLSTTFNILSSFAFSHRIYKVGKGESGDAFTSSESRNIVHALNSIIGCLGPQHVQTYLPFMGMFRTNPAVKVIADGKKHIVKFQSQIYEDHKATLDPENPRDVVDRLIMLEESDGLCKDDIMQIISDLVLGGTETTALTISWGIFDLAKNPQVQKKLKDEIKQAFGQGQPITLENIDNLTYIHAFIKEVARQHPVGPLSIPHVNPVDEQVLGYDIPANTIIFTNFYNIFKNPELWGDAETFRPERWLEPNGMRKSQEHLMMFSVGPRKCVGEHLATRELRLFFAMMLNKFSFELRDSSFEPKEELGLTLAPSAVPVIIRKD